MIEPTDLIRMRVSLFQCYEAVTELTYVSDPYLRDVLMDSLEYKLDKLMDVIEGPEDGS